MYVVLLQKLNLLQSLKHLLMAKVNLVRLLVNEHPLVVWLLVSMRIVLSNEILLVRHVV